ncbi:type II secretion system GspH family protein [Massilia endophytica]|nr:type II secretion system GspH family protein [Massilia endophytica]
MTELITVMVIIGVLAVVAVPRLVGNTDMSSRSFHTDVQSALRYAQKVASSHRRLVCATVGASNISLNIASANPALACDTSLASPDGKPYASQDVAITASGALLGTLYFQPTGRITTDPAGTIAASGSIAITGANSVRIDGATGHVD